MKRVVYSSFVLFLLCVTTTSCDKDDPKETPSTPVEASTTLFDEILFYDGYAATVNKPVPFGIIRVSNAKYTTKITDSHLNSINNSLKMEITIKAACDNYDRGGHVFLSLVDKGKVYDKDNLADRIEIARFITPFMDKNKQPNKVSYSFKVDNIASLLKDPVLNNKYDFWIEFEIFGVPYAANNEIEGCAGRNDTFYGTLKLISTNESYTGVNQYLKPIASHLDFNNYKNTDIIGKTTKTFKLDIESTITNAKIYLITSSHGANQGGEEYNRRNHYVYFDGELIDTYIPGGKSCEPYRIFNTQNNGIYSLKPRTPKEWASFSNWCPGDKIPIRIYDMGNMGAGNHIFKIEVPDAVFVDGKGNIPLSVYIQGDQ